MDVWVIETGEYEQRFVWAVASSPEKATELVKQAYGKPYKVQWKELQKDDENCYTLEGKFSSVNGYSTSHTDYWEFSRYPVDSERPDP